QRYASQISRVEELSGPKFNSSKSNSTEESDGKNKSDEIAKRIEEAKSNGWGFQVKEFVQGKKYAVMALGIILTFVMGGFVAASAINGDSGLASGLSGFKGALVALNNNSENSEEETQSTVNIDVPNGKITQTVQSGEGVTHLARRTIATHLENSEHSLTAEQKIYAEDHLRKTVNKNSLEPGEEVVFTLENVEKAIDEAISLEEWQLDNLKQYTQNMQL
ncbi:MAG: hypothetical protein WDZ39_01075, partial [Candidatus Spechtbacterales bacterium]